MVTGKNAADASLRNPMDLPSLEDLGKLIEQFKLPGVDVNALVEWQRKDLESLAEANRQAYDGIKALVERRNEILQETLAQWQEALKSAADKDVLARQSEAAKQSVKQAVDNFRELSAMEAQARSNTWKLVQDRMQENMGVRFCRDKPVEADEVRQLSGSTDRETVKVVGM